MKTRSKGREYFITGLALLVLVAGFLSYRLLLVRAASGIDPWAFELQQPIENELKWASGGGWNQYTSRYQNISFRYSLFEDHIEENDGGITITQAGDFDYVADDRSSAVSVRTLENNRGLSLTNWWLFTAIMQRDWKTLWESKWQRIDAGSGRSRLLVVGGSPWDGRQYVYTYFSCGQKVCEVRMQLEQDEYGESVYRRLLMTAEGWQPIPLGFNPEQWDQRYENMLAGYAIRYPGFDVDKSVRAPERDQDEANPTDRVVRLPTQIGMTIAATFCSIPGSQWDYEDIEKYLQDIPRAGFRERWSIRLSDENWAQVVRIVGRDALAGLRTYQGPTGESNERVIPDEAVYIKRGGLLLVITLNGLGRKDLFDAIVSGIELLPMEDLIEKTGDEACAVQWQGWQDSVGAYWANEYVVMYLREGEKPSEDTRLVGVYPENFENLGHGWGKQTENGWILCRGKRNYMEYTSFRIIDPENGIAENDHGKYQCAETGFVE